MELGCFWLGFAELLVLASPSFSFDFSDLSALILEMIKFIYYRKYLIEHLRWFVVFSGVRVRLC